jgi:hypothetical protein
LDVGFQGKERQKKIGYWVSSKRKLARNWILCLNQKKGGMKLDVGFPAKGDKILDVGFEAKGLSRNWMSGFKQRKAGKKLGFVFEAKERWQEIGCWVLSKR